jgi:drug/metabolite transporter (DMT)-like permease
MKNDLLLLATAAIWGFAFVAQRAGMEFIGPHSYNALRFLLGALSLLPLLILFRTAKVKSGHTPLKLIIAAGLLLFGGSALQQMGLVFTTAGKAGFITGLYVVLVPILGIFMGISSGGRRWTGAAAALAGLYFLSVDSAFTVSGGDLLVMASAVFFAAHLLLISRIAGRADLILLSIGQYLVCALLSALLAVFLGEDLPGAAVRDALPAILYGGIMSVGIAYSLQIVAQRKAHPTHAAIILCAESLFAAAGGALILAERMNLREGLGALLMFAGMLISQSRYAEVPIPDGESGS